MDDTYATRSRHGHFQGKAMIWLDHAMVDGKPCSFMVMFGSRIIGDKACYRIGTEQEVFFEPRSVQRDDIILQGKEIIRTRLPGHQILTTSGQPYPWDSAEASS